MGKTSSSWLEWSKMNDSFHEQMVVLVLLLTLFLLTERVKCSPFLEMIGRNGNFQKICASLKFLFEEAVFDFGVSGISNEMLDCPGFHTAKNAVAESTLTPRVRAGKPT